MSDQEIRVGEQRPGGRAARVRSAVLDATNTILDDVGYDGLSVEDVADAAGVHKTTVYRRWPTKAELIADAVRARSAETIPVPDTGSFAGDLQLLARLVSANLDSEVGARRSRSIVSAATASDDLMAEVHAFFRHRFEVTGVIVERAIERGEVAADVDPTIVIETLVGALWLRLLLTGGTVDEAVADEVASIVVAGVRRP